MKFEGTMAHIRQTLPKPEESDGTDEIARKLRHIANVVKQGFSAAKATGFQLEAPHLPDPEILAEFGMSATEKEQYAAFRAGVQLPPFDWELYKAAVPEGEGVIERYVKRAAAIGVMYKKKDVLPEHASWLTNNWEYALPLVTAISRVQNARRDMAEGLEYLNDMEMNEIQVLRDMNSIASNHLRNIYPELDRLGKSIKDLYNSYKDSKKKYEDSYKKYEDSYNKYEDSKRTYQNSQKKYEDLNKSYKDLRILYKDIGHSQELLRAREHALTTKINGSKPNSEPIPEQRNPIDKKQVSGTSENSSALRRSHRLKRRVPEYAIDEDEDTEENTAPIASKRARKLT